MTVQGVTSIAIIKILMVKSEGISFTAQSIGPFIYYLKFIFSEKATKVDQCTLGTFSGIVDPTCNHKNSKGAFTNYVDKKRWLGSPKMGPFCQRL